MRIGVVGVGAIGATYAWFLARAGHEVAVLDVRASHVAAIARRGLVAELPDATAVAAAVEAATDPSGLAPAEVALVATKAFATEAAVRGAGPLIGPGTWIATVQNGLGNDRALARAVGAARVVPGSTTVAAETAADGRVRVGESVLAGRSSTVFGPPRGVVAIPPALESFAAALTEAGLPAHVDPDVDLVIWRKLVLAGSMGPLSAALGLTVAGTMASPPAVDLLRRLVAEIAAVATACGAALDPDEAWELCRATFGGLGEHRASMAVDLAEGRRTEIDAMCVEVARLGREHGVGRRSTTSSASSCARSRQPPWVRPAPSRTRRRQPDCSAAAAPGHAAAPETGITERTAPNSWSSLAPSRRAAPAWIWTKSDANSDALMPQRISSTRTGERALPQGAAMQARVALERRL